MDIKFNLTFISKRPVVILVMALSTFIFSCSSDDMAEPGAPELPTIKFNNTSLNVEENSSSTLNVDLSLSAALEEAGTITITIDDGSTATSSDYTTYPEASAGMIEISLPKGITSASFTVTPIDNDDLNDDKTIIFVISAADGGVELANSDLTATVTIPNDDVASDNLLFNENFDYGNTADDLTAVSDWERYSGELNPIQYIVDGLSFEGYGSSAIGGAVTFEGGEGSREDVQIQFDPRNSGTIYLAQIINISSAEATESGDFFLALRDPGDGFFNRLYAKDNGSGKLLLGTARTRSGGGSEVFSTTEYSYDTNYLVVLKYDFDTKLASMFVFDDSVPATEPATPDVVADTGAEPASLEEIIIRQAATVIVGSIDGIRVGTTWETALGL
jgi:hypothetical protein